jgi:hypothetical protein
MIRLLRSVCMAALLSPASGSAFANSVTCRKSEDPRGNGYCAVLHSRNPESWVRGSATLDTGTGVVSMALQLETDSATAGPCGRMLAILRGETDSDLAVLDMTQEICRGGKRPGKAAVSDYSLQKAVTKDIAARTKSIVVLLDYTKSKSGLWNIPMKTVVDAIKLLVASR